MAPDRRRARLPSPSVPSSPGVLRSSRAGAARGVPPARAAVWRVQPPWVSLAGHGGQRGSEWSGGGGDDTPSFDEIVPCVNPTAGWGSLLCPGAHADRWLCRLQKKLDGWGINVQYIEMFTGQKWATVQRWIEGLTHEGVGYMLQWNKIKIILYLTYCISVHILSFHSNIRNAFSGMSFSGETHGSHIIKHLFEKAHEQHGFPFT